MGGRLFALREAESKPQVLWEYVIGKHAPGPVVVGPEDGVFLHAADGCLHCIDGASGKQKRPPAYVGEPLGSAAPVVDREGNAWISAPEGGILKVDARGRVHEPSPFFRSRQKFDSAGVLVGGALYILAESGAIFAIATEGQQGASLWSHAGDRGFAGWRAGAAPAVTDDGLLVVAGHDQFLLGFAADGDLLWKTQMPGQTLGAARDRPPWANLCGSGPVSPRAEVARVAGLRGRQQPQNPLGADRGGSGRIDARDRRRRRDLFRRQRRRDSRGRFSRQRPVDRGGRLARASAGTIFAPGRVAFGLDNQTLIVLRCSSPGLATSGWPKFGGGLGQRGSR